MTARLDELMAIQPVIPVITIAARCDGRRDRWPKALVICRQSCPFMEVTLRTEAGALASNSRRMNTGERRDRRARAR